MSDLERSNGLDERGVGSEPFPLGCSVMYQEMSSEQGLYLWNLKTNERRRINLPPVTATSSSLPSLLKSTTKSSHILTPMRTLTQDSTANFTGENSPECADSSVPTSSLSSTSSRARPKAASSPRRCSSAVWKSSTRPPGR